MSTGNSIDYFATLGRKENALSLKKLKSFWDESELVEASDVWSNAITDISVVKSKKDLDEMTEDWVPISESIDGASLEDSGLEATIIVKRRATTKRLDHICQIRLVKQGKPIPVGWELVFASLSGEFSGSLTDLNSNDGIFLAYQRADCLNDNNMYLAHGHNLIDDICVVLAGEDVPEGRTYVHLDKTIHSKKAKWNVSYNQSQPLGLCDLRYESTTLDRYPLKDHKAMPLPVGELPMFVFPHDLQVVASPKTNYPLPIFFTFVFTDANGAHFYAACLQFYEIVPREEISGIIETIYGSEDEKKELPADIEIFCPKVICVVSRQPFYRAMRRYLRQLYSLSMSVLTCPIEYFLSAIISQVPVPMEGGRPFHVLLDAAMISSTSKSMAPIIFDVPRTYFFPHMDLDFAGPLRCLSVDNMLAVFMLLLNEEKVVFTCASNTMLTEVMETFKCLLFPLRWSSCFVSRLPDALSGLLQAPGGFMIGMHVNPMYTNEIVNVQDRESSYKDDNGKLSSKKWLDSIMFGSYIVDLSSNVISKFDKQAQDHGMSQSKIKSMISNYFPSGPLKRLHKSLQQICAEFKIGPQPINLEQFDSAFEIQRTINMDDDGEGAMDYQLTDFPSLHLRDIFMVFMADILGEYWLHIVMPTQKEDADACNTLKEEFAIDEYIAESDKSVRPLLLSLTKTQMFSVLIQQRSESDCTKLVFFERASAVLREIKLSALGHTTWSYPTSPTTSQLANHAPLTIDLYKLVAARDYAELTDLQLHDSRESAISTGRSGSNDLMSPQNRNSLEAKTVDITEKILAVARALDLKERESVTVNTYDAIAEDHDDRNGEDLTSCSSMSQRRSEMNTLQEFHLQNSMLGPLIIPGPSPFATTLCKANDQNKMVPEEEDKYRARRASMTIFSYQHGWPDVNHRHLDCGREFAHPSLLAIRAVRVYSVEVVSPIYSVLTRSHHDRFSFRVSGKLMANGCKSKTPPIGIPSSPIMSPVVSSPRGGHYGSLDNGNIPIKAEMKVSVSVLLDVVSTSILFLSARIIEGVQPLSNILQILGLLSQLESVSCLLQLDETVWRSILTGCATAGGPFMRFVSFIIFDAMMFCDFVPNASTFGKYAQCHTVTTGYKRTNAYDDIAESNATGKQVDMFLFLQEIGLAWLTQRAALAELNSSVVSNSTSARESIVEATAVNHGNASSVSANQSPSPVRNRFIPSMNMFSSAATHHANGNNNNSNYNNINKTVSATQLTFQDRLLAKSKQTLISAHGASALVAGQMELSRYYNYNGFGSMSFLLPKHFCFHISAPYSSLEQTNAVSSSTDSVVADVHEPLVLEENSSICDIADKKGAQTTVDDMKVRFLKILSDCDTTKKAALKKRASSESLSPSYASSEAVSTAHRSVPNGASFGQSPMGSTNGGSSWSMSRIRNVFKKSPLPVPTSPVQTTGVKQSMVTPVDAHHKTLDSSVDGTIDPSLDLVPTDLYSDMDKEVEGVTVVEGSDVDDSKVVVEEVDVSAVTVDINRTSILSDDTESVDSGFGDDNVGNEVHMAKEASAEVLSVTLPAVVEVPSTPVKSVADIQEELFQYLVQQVQSSSSVHEDKDNGAHPGGGGNGRKACGIFSQTSCACGFALLDEEVMATWSGYGPNPLNVDESSEDILAAHCYACPACRLEITPKLHVRYYDEKINGNEEGGAKEVEIEVVHSVDVLHLSSYGVRFFLEEALLRVGAKAMHSSWLQSHYPAVFWGVLWYGARIGGIPNGLIMDDRSNALDAGVYMADRPVFVGWREVTVQLRAKYHVSSSAYPYVPLGLSDFVPLCRCEGLNLTEDVSSAITAIASECFSSTIADDGSDASTKVPRMITEDHIRYALVAVSKLPEKILVGMLIADNCLEFSELTDQLKARCLFLVLLTLVNLVKPKQLLGLAENSQGIESNIVLTTSQKASTFDQLLHSAVVRQLRLDMSGGGSDTLPIQVLTELKDMVSNKGVQHVRLSLGHLL